MAQGRDEEQLIKKDKLDHDGMAQGRDDTASAMAITKKRIVRRLGEN
jgi:hypothetical protein